MKLCGLGSRFDQVCDVTHQEDAKSDKEAARSCCYWEAITGQLVHSGLIGSKDGNSNAGAVADLLEVARAAAE